MCMEDANATRLRTEGKVVEILHDGHRRRLKVALGPWAEVELDEDDARDLHLGDRLVVEALVSHAARLEPVAGHVHAHDESGHAGPHGHDAAAPRPPSGRRSS